LDAGTREKLRIMGADFLPELTKFVAPAAIPAFLGGELVGPGGDRECKHIIGPGESQKGAAWCNRVPALAVLVGFKFWCGAVGLMWVLQLPCP
jgi:hypothetical protein